MSDDILQISGLTVEFDLPGGRMRAVDDLSLTIGQGQTMGLVGESGCGKSVSALAIMGLLPRPGAHISAGSIVFRGTELTVLGERDYRPMRGRDIAMIFQNPMTALNPVVTVGRQVTTMLTRHRNLTGQRARSEAIAMLERLDISRPAERMNSYPHQLSAGMRQRVVIAMAMSCRPGLLIADEATTALDATTEARILEQMLALCSDFGTAALIISHDFGIVARTCEKAAVMYCGRIVEQAGTEELFSRPRHPYSAGLLAAVPDLRQSSPGRLQDIPGQVPGPDNMPAGCPFAPRCPSRRDQCERAEPPMVHEGHRQFRCYYPLSSRYDEAEPFTEP